MGSCEYSNEEGFAEFKSDEEKLKIEVS